MSPLVKPAPTEVCSDGVARLPSPWAHALHKPVFIIFLLSYAVNLGALLLDISLPQQWRWLDRVLWLLGAASSAVGLARRLPEQNVFVSAIVIAAISTAIAVAGEKTGVPFGPRIYTDVLGAKILDLPWTVPLLWLAVIINGRGVARLIMRPWRKTTYYGFWVIGLTCALSVVFDAGLEPFATQVRRYWFWGARVSVLNWYAAPWVNFLGWFATTLGILGFTTPWLINKQPIKQPTDYHPLTLWLLLNAYFAAGNALQQLWPAVLFGFGANLIAAIFAMRGAPRQAALE